MNKIKVGEQVKRMLLTLASHDDGETVEPLSPEEWEATFTIMGLQVAFHGELPPPVADECCRTMQEVALRTGLPLHVVQPESPKRGY